MSGNGTDGNKSSAIAARRARAVESFQSAAECIGPVDRDMALFAVTRGQFSMIDAVLHCLDQVGPAEISLWTWTVAEYEIQCLERLMLDRRITGALLVVDHGARKKNRALLEKWQSVFGPDSIRLVVNHSKVATIAAADGRRVLLRGSMNLNFNPRFEQLDVTEGGQDYELVKRIESELPILAMDADGAAVYKASRVAGAFDAGALKIFSRLKVWAK